MKRLNRTSLRRRLLESKLAIAESREQMRLGDPTALTRVMVLNGEIKRLRKLQVVAEYQQRQHGF